MRTAVIGLLATCAGCVGGGRVTGGVMTGSAGTTGFVAATFEVGTIAPSLARLTFEAGETASEAAPATHVGLRYDAAHDRAATFTASAGAEYGDDGGYAQLSTGVAVVAPALDRETPDVLGGHLVAAAVEGVLGLGGPALDDLGVRFGVQLALEVLWFGLMR